MDIYFTIVINSPATVSVMNPGLQSQEPDEKNVF